jgi:hypothetical protein
MEIIDKANKLERAKKRVEELKKFYKHVAFFIVIHAFFIGRRIYKDIEYGDSVIEAFTDISNYRLFFWWSVILVLHGLKTYRFDFFFGKNWEERKIKEEMNKNKNL